MARRLNLRQVEAFKAVIEHGTVSRAAEMLNVSQPAMSKLIAHLEADTGLRLFDRLKGRLAPTQRGMRLYQEVDRIFAGVRQVENAVETIRRDEQGRLLIGVVPALSDTFIRQATMRFRALYPDTFCSIQSHSSQWIADGLVTRKLDVGLVVAPIDNPYIMTEPLMSHPVVCIMGPGHRLAMKETVTPADIVTEPFVSFDPESYTGRRVGMMLNANSVKPNIVMIATVAATLCEFVAAGVGISLVHPFVSGAMREQLIMRRFEPAIDLEFQLCRIRDSRNARLVDAFAEEARGASEEMSQTILNLP